MEKFGIAWCIDLGRRQLAESERVLADHAFALAEARRIFRDGRRAGTIRRWARARCANAKKLGITHEKPYRVMTEEWYPDHRYLAIADDSDRNVSIPMIALGLAAARRGTESGWRPGYAEAAAAWRGF